MNEQPSLSHAVSFQYQYAHSKEGRPQSLQFYKDYLICSPLGSGGEGEVLLVYQPQEKKMAVLKHFHAYAKLSYVRERDVY